MSAEFLEPSKRLQSWRDSHGLGSKLLDKSRVSSIRLGEKKSNDYCSSTASTFRSLKPAEGHRTSRQTAVNNNSIHLGARENDPESFHTSALMSLYYTTSAEGRNPNAVVHDDLRSSQRYPWKRFQTKEEVGLSNLKLGNGPRQWETEQAEEFVEQALPPIVKLSDLPGEPTSKSHVVLGTGRETWQATTEAHYNDPKDRKSTSSNRRPAIPRLAFPKQRTKTNFHPIKIGGAFSAREWCCDKDLSFGLAGSKLLQTSFPQTRRKADPNLTARLNYKRDFSTTHEEFFQDRFAQAQQAIAEEQKLLSSPRPGAHLKRKEGEAPRGITFGTHPSSYETNSNEAVFPLGRLPITEEFGSSKVRTRSHIVLGSVRDKWQSTFESSYVEPAEVMTARPRLQSNPLPYTTTISPKPKPKPRSFPITGNSFNDYAVTSWSDFDDKTGPKSIRQRKQVEKEAAETKLRFSNASWSMGKHPGLWISETEQNFSNQFTRPKSVQRVRRRLRIQRPQSKPKTTNVVFGTEGVDSSTYTSATHTDIGPVARLLQTQPKAVIPLHPNPIQERHASTSFYSSNTMSRYYRPM